MKRLIWTGREVKEIVAIMHEECRRKAGDAEPADVIAWNEGVDHFAIKLIRLIEQTTQES